MRNIKGQAIVETALILPLLFILIFGMVDFGRVIYAKNTLNNAARSGARAAAVTPALVPRSSAPLSTSSDVEPEKTILQNILKDQDRINYELNIIPAHTPAQTGDQIQVILTWPRFEMITPLYKLLAPPSSYPLTITGEASMRYE